MLTDRHPECSQAQAAATPRRCQIDRSGRVQALSNRPLCAASLVLGSLRQATHWWWPAHRAAFCRNLEAEHVSNQRTRRP